MPLVCWTYRGCRQRGLWHRHVMKPQTRSVAFERVFPKWWDLDYCKFALEVNWFFNFPRICPSTCDIYSKNISHHCQKNWKFLLLFSRHMAAMVFYQPRSGKSLSEMRYPVRTLRSWIRSQTFNEMRPYAVRSFLYYQSQQLYNMQLHHLLSRSCRYFF